MRGAERRGVKGRRPDPRRVEKLDAAIGIVGALVVLGALGVIAVQGTQTGVHVTFVEVESGVGEGNRQHLGEGAFTDVYEFTVADPRAARLLVTARAEFLGTGTGASLHARLVAPNGTAHEADAQPDPGTPGSPASAAVQFSVDVAPAPPDVLVPASSPEEAEREAAEAAATGGAVGTWTLEVSFSPGPAPVNSATSSWEGRLVSWAPRAHR